jgi:hypothetical protein
MMWLIASVRFCAASCFSEKSLAESVSRMLTQFCVENIPELLWNSNQRVSFVTRSSL